MTQADHIIGKAGGVTALSRMLGHKHRTTVQGWEETGIIPLKNWIQIRRVLRGFGIRLTFNDFVRHLPWDDEIAA